MRPEVLAKVRSALVQLELEYCEEHGASPYDVSGPTGIESASIGLRRMLAKKKKKASAASGKS